MVRRDDLTAAKLEFEVTSADRGSAGTGRGEVDGAFPTATAQRQCLPLEDGEAQDSSSPNLTFIRRPGSRSPMSSTS